jgi:hypothetical protein
MEHEIAPIFVIMFIAGLLTTMNVYTTNFEDMRWSINDVYTSLMICGWMFLIWGIVYQMTKHTIIGLILLTISFYGIRTQFLITPNQYIKGMIPRYSKTITMSKKLLEKQQSNPQLSSLVNNIIITQQNEINLMKKLEI